MSTIETPREQLEAAIPARIVEIFRTRFLEIFTVAALTLLPIELLDLGVRLAWRLDVPILPASQTIMGWVVGFVTALLAPYAILHHLMRYPRGSVGAAFSSVAAAAENLTPLLELWLRMTIGIVAGLILLLLPGIRRICGWFVAIPVLVSERSGPKDAMLRSVELTRGSQVMIFGLILVTTIVGMVFRGGMERVGTELFPTRHALTFLCSWIGMVLAQCVLAVALHSTYSELSTRERALPK